MLVKLMISLVIIGCSSLIGIIYANTFIERTKLLANVLSTLQMLETEIVFSATPLPELLSKVGKKSRAEIGCILEATAEILGKKEGDLFSEAWRKAVERESVSTVFTKEDIQILLALGNTLGISDTHDQVKHIRLAMEEIKRNYELSIIVQNKSVRLYRNLGFLVGITIVIVFF
ncbi:stage III sporulation protein SpoIIIAB [Clostridium formicaceticum]|uniref:Stage III sporulation protein AB n=1 Tax=Clostridium formicaceticum TaxID=1497 RepID=A0AAC9RLK8_9CLOT|nr:stage III sporulation protein SpoIIIAB [Clostridium formicaceticum]AOY77062.1 stage III sporulation protein AB [Clostridium formicaceticum]ARE87565.1 stage III sporulation protein SpoAB [Clostridium formicaceticum]